MKGQFGILLCALCFALVVALIKKGCKKENCPGPVRFYEGMRCQPIYENPDDCCAVRYNCDHLKTRSPNKCYAAGYDYNIDELLRPEDRECNYHCKCKADPEGNAIWACNVVYHGMPKLSHGCYFAWNASTCNPDPEICPKTREEIPKCKVDGKTYFDGDDFIPKEEPWKKCWCGPEYKGENVAPFCEDTTKVDCHFETRDDDELRDQCIPVYEASGSPVLDCNTHWRCPNHRDVVVERVKSSQVSDGNGANSNNYEGMNCQFGNLTMYIGDQLNRDTAFDSNCVKCICDVPPVPTCQYAPNCNKWDVKLRM